MKGLELSRAFWENAVRPAIRETCPVLLPRLAAGLCGGGSDCLGYDDELSRDHGYAAGYMLRALENQKKRPGDLDLAVTYVNLAQHYAAQDENDARIAACLDKAMERMDSPDAVWEYYYAHTARKIAPALEALGRADAARDLRERADIIYEGT